MKMAINAHKLGPGLLTLGAAGSGIELGLVCTKAQVTPEAGEGETIIVLSGDTDTDAPSDTFKLEATLLQSLEESGAVAWSWKNAGTEIDFTFVPNKQHTMQIKGRVKPTRLVVGGDVDTRNSSEISWQCVGTPTMTHDYVVTGG